MDSLQLFFIIASVFCTWRQSFWCLSQTALTADLLRSVFPCCLWFVSHVADFDGWAMLLGGSAKTAKGSLKKDGLEKIAQSESERSRQAFWIFVVCRLIRFCQHLPKHLKNQNQSVLHA